MKKTVLSIIVVMLGVVGILYVVGQMGGQRSKIVKEGDPAPEFSLLSLDGRQVSLSQYRGKVVMVHFWATWCPPCVEEMPTIESLLRSVPAKDFQILAVSVDEGGAGSVGPFMQKNRLTLPVLLSPDHAASTLYGTFKFPETYLVDRAGVIRRKLIGAVDWSNPEAKKVIQAMVEGK